MFLERVIAKNQLPFQTYIAHRWTLTIKPPTESFSRQLSHARGIPGSWDVCKEIAIVPRAQGKPFLIKSYRKAKGDYYYRYYE
jgi:hypothetical protein